MRNDDVLIIDTRQKKGKHIEKETYFDMVGIKYIHSKLYVGDYSKLKDMSVSVDTKQDIIEIANNCCGKSHTRFRDECIRAKEAGIKLYILIEEPVIDLANWKSPTFRNGRPLTKVKGETLKKVFSTMTEKYGVEFLFCTKTESPRQILKLLNINISK